MPVPDSVSLAVCAAQRAQGQQVENIATLLESWVGQPGGMPDVVPRAAAAAWDAVADTLKVHDEILLGYIGDPSASPADAATDS